ncbi:hypothetical protein V8E36_004864 [Tilletia maclaganii]
MNAIGSRSFTLFHRLPALRYASTAPCALRTSFDAFMSPSSSNHGRGGAGDAAAQATSASRAAVLASVHRGQKRNHSISASAKASSSNARPLSERPANVESAPSLKRAAESDDAQANAQPAKVPKPSFSRQESESRKEIEFDDLESGMEAYDWRKPNFPVNSSGSPRIVYISSRNDRELDGLLKVLGQRPSYTDAEAPLVLGFDLEWEVTFRKGAAPEGSRTALMQICSRSLILVLHIAHIVPTNTGTLPPLPQALEALLRRPDVLKTGVYIEGDALKLQREFCQRAPAEQGDQAATQPTGEGIQTQGLLELSRLARQVDPGRWPNRRLISLRELVAVYLGRKLLKDSVRTSKWAQSKLSPDQLRYAASDVLSGLEVYEALRRRANARSEGKAESLEPLKLRRNIETIMSERQEQRAEVLRRARAGRLGDENAAPAAATSQGSGTNTEASQLSEGASQESASAYNTAPESFDSQAETDAFESQDSTFEPEESQMSLADDEQATDTVMNSESQMSTSEDAGPKNVTFAEAVRLSTLELGAPAPAASGSRSGRSTGSSPTKAAQSTPKAPLSHQRTFDLWAYGNEHNPVQDATQGSLTFQDIAARNNVKVETVAGYVLRAFSEGRHAGSTATAADAAEPVHAALRARLAEELRDPAMKVTIKRNQSWLRRQAIVASPPPSPGGAQKTLPA